MARLRRDEGGEGKDEMHMQGILAGVKVLCTYRIWIRGNVRRRLLPCDVQIVHKFFYPMELSVVRWPYSVAFRCIWLVTFIECHARNGPNKFPDITLLI